MVAMNLPRTSRHWLMIHDNFIRRIATFEAALKEAGISYRCTGAFRTDLQQARMYAQGRSRKGLRITNADAGESPHNYCLARDYALLRGKDSIHDANDQDWIAFNALAIASHLVTGREFMTLRDCGHVQHPTWRLAVIWPKS